MHLCIRRFSVIRSSFLLSVQVSYQTISNQQSKRFDPNLMNIWNVSRDLHYIQPRRWRNGLERSPRKRMLGCSNPIRDRPKVVKHVVTALLPNVLQCVCVCHGSSEMTNINGCPCHSRCGTLENPNDATVV